MNYFPCIDMLKEFVSTKHDTVHTQVLLTCFMKACLHDYRYEINYVEL